jgi:structural maintenance of chromosome 3 (chondroitin sulfate proteoglycan 6)
LHALNDCLQWCVNALIGKVTEMATASDECRLQVMREVAGTRIYDDRKSEAMKLLAEATQRVEQMDDCLHSLDDRLDSLQNESNDLQRFLKWDKRRRLLEYIIANKEAESNKHEMLRLEAKQDRENLVLDDKRKKLEDFQLKTKTCDKTLKVINGLLQEYRKDLSAINRNIDELNEQKARIESKINDFKEKLDFNRENESKANEELKEVK